MSFQDLLKGKKYFVFGFDDVLYPKKDYLLQVYYLFSELMAYTEQLDAKALLAYIKQVYEENGEADLFKSIQKKFGIADKYQENFARLHTQARLPLKLLMYKQILSFIQEIVLERGEIFLILDGDAETQLNKLKHLEWNGLEKYVKLYFTQEYNQSVTDTLQFILLENKLSRDEILLIKSHHEWENQELLQQFYQISINKILID